MTLVFDYVRQNLFLDILINILRIIRRWKLQMADGTRLDYPINNREGSSQNRQGKEVMREGEGE